MEPQLPKSNPTEALSLTDEALFEALKKKDASALSILFNRYGRLVYGLALKILKNSQEAEDLTQEIFLALWRNASRYPDCRYFGRYLISMTRSRAIDKLRSRGRHLKLLEQWGQTMTLETLSPTPVERATLAERSQRIRAALTQLPDKQRQALEMAYDEGLTQVEIARRLDIPLGTVKTCTRQGLLKLKQILLDFGI
ncbi:sigma-70 family RNA polymerase sigma factor [Scytonema millei]|uniref:Sigma-70 family RNA polymerase sigma factor n=1 Tax=Scytonema millei VB511283 TaxID=1245923 RepID=A0A9X5E8N3_9CYAN|nr:sigma-70 family RNA polymerase sigma factor [Scytonema millei]NHC37400.1 sigma-70 family RNA polymerase sigma factor [Scytonema millei VB511283]